MNYVTIASTGNAIDFGELTKHWWIDKWGTASQTRGLFAGGRETVLQETDVIEYITISTLGNAADFGDLTNASGKL